MDGWINIVKRERDKVDDAYVRWIENVCLAMTYLYIWIDIKLLSIFKKMYICVKMSRK